MREKNKLKRRSPKTVLRLPDLDHSKSSALQTLGSAASQRTYAFAIDDFISWYCSEPRLAFGRTVVLRYRYYLEARQLAPATINLRLAAKRCLNELRVCATTPLAIELYWPPCEIRTLPVFQPCMQAIRSRHEVALDKCIDDLP